jgi:predicted TIM-barrel fold metal-dependent hydrolase
MLTIDSDGHLHEPFDLFDRYIEKEFHALRPRVIDMPGEARDQGRWLAEGRVVPRIPFSRGVGGGGFNYPTPRHKQMKARDNSLDDIPGRLDDLDLMGVDYQVVFPTALVWVFDLENAELAGAVCRAYNNYVAEQCSKASKRLNAIAMVPIQDPAGAAEEARRAVGQLGLAGVLLPGMAGNRPLHALEYEPFFAAVDELDTPIGFHAVTGMHDTPWADCFKDFFSTHVTAMPFSMMVALMSVTRMGLMEDLPNLRFAFLEIDGQWLHYWANWVNRHVDDAPRVSGGYHREPGWGDEPYLLPEGVRNPHEYIQSGRFLSGYSEHEDLRYLIDHLGPRTFMYASDYPHSDMDWGRVDAIKSNDSITREERDALLGGNAQRFYKLELG